MTLHNLASLPPWTGSHPQAFQGAVILVKNGRCCEDRAAFARRALNAGIGGVSMELPAGSGDSTAEAIEEFHATGLPVIVGIRSGQGASCLDQLNADALRIAADDLCDELLLGEVGRIGKPVLLDIDPFVSPGDILRAVAVLRAQGSLPQVLLMWQGGRERRWPDAAAWRAAFELPMGFTLSCPLLDKRHLDWLVALSQAQGYLLLEIGRSEKVDWSHVRQVARDVSISVVRSNRAFLAERRDPKQLVAVQDLPAGVPINRTAVAYRPAAPGHGWSPALDLVIGSCPRRDIRRGEVIRLFDLSLWRVALIQVRRRSRRLPDKAVMRLGQRNALEHVLNRCLRAKELEAVVVCTTDLEEDAELIRIGQAMGASGFQGSQNNVLKRFLDAAEAFDADILVRITGDNPLIDPDCIDGAMRCHMEQSADYTATVGLPVGTGLEIFNTQALKMAYMLAENPEYSEDLTYYLRRPDIFRTCSYTPPDHYIAPDLVLALNRPEDAELLRVIFEALEHEEGVFPLSEAIGFLRAHPELAERNMNYTPKPTACDARLSFSRFMGIKRSGS